VLWGRRPGGRRLAGKIDARSALPVRALRPVFAVEGSAEMSQVGGENSRKGPPGAAEGGCSRFFPGDKAPVIDDRGPRWIWPRASRGEFAFENGQLRLSDAGPEAERARTTCRLGREGRGEEMGGFSAIVSDPRAARQKHDFHRPSALLRNLITRHRSLDGVPLRDGRFLRPCAGISRWCRRGPARVSPHRWADNIRFWPRRAALPRWGAPGGPS